MQNINCKNSLLIPGEVCSLFALLLSIIADFWSTEKVCFNQASCSCVTTSFASPCSDPRRVNRMIVSLEKFASRQNYLLFKSCGRQTEGSQITIPQLNKKHKKQMGQNI